MLVKRGDEIRHSELTPKNVYLNRRRFLATMPLAGAALFTTRAGAAAKLSAIKGPFSTDETSRRSRTSPTTTISTNSAPAKTSRPRTPVS